MKDRLKSIMLNVEYELNGSEYSTYIEIEKNIDDKYYTIDVFEREKYKYDGIRRTITEENMPFRCVKNIVKRWLKDESAS